MDESLANPKVTPNAPDRIVGDLGRSFLTDLGFSRGADLRQTT